MNQLPFSAYDFFGCLSSGAIVIAGVTAAFVGDAPFRQGPSLPVGIVLVIAAYVIGHIVAGIAGDLIERRLVADRLGRPVSILLGERQLPRWASRIFRGYGAQLPGGTQQRIRAAAPGLTGSTLFFHCFAVMKRDELVRERLDTFLNLYGFARNTSLALLIAATCLVAGIAIGSADTGSFVGPWWWAGASLLGAVGMLYRYLKFYRQYGQELLVSYAERETP
jgi:hypothetical protein